MASSLYALRHRLCLITGFVVHSFEGGDMGLSIRWPAVAVVLAALPLMAQEQPRVQTFEEAIDVRVVNVEAVVTDAAGRQVRGLTAGDFRLLVDGREVPVEYFTEVADGLAADGGGQSGAIPSPASAGEA